MWGERLLDEGNWFAGIDAGGTATKAWLYRQNVGLVGRGTGPAGNVVVAGAAGVAESINQALERASLDAGLAAIPRIRFLAACVAGARGLREQTAVKEAVAQRLVGTSISVHPDAAAGLIAGTLGSPGVVVIAGTGSTVWAMGREGVWQRAGGWGYLLGDEGSGFFIGLEALKALVQAADGLGKPTALVDAVMAEWNLNNLSELLPIVYSHPIPRQRIASLAPLVMEWAKKGDAVAARIVQRTVDELVRLAYVGVEMASLEGETPLIVVGGVFENEEIMADFTAEIQRSLSDVKVCRPIVDPAAGACILALQQAGVWTADEREILLQSYSSSPI